MKGLGFLQLRVLQLLTEAGGEMRARELVAATRAKPACVDASLRRLSKRGLVRRVRHGVWAAA